MVGFGIVAEEASGSGSGTSREKASRRALVPPERRTSVPSFTRARTSTRWQNITTQLCDFSCDFSDHLLSTSFRQKSNRTISLKFLWVQNPPISISSSPSVACHWLHKMSINFQFCFNSHVHGHYKIPEKERRSQVTNRSWVPQITGRKTRDAERTNNATETTPTHQNYQQTYLEQISTLALSLRRRPTTPGATPKHLEAAVSKTTRNR